MFGRRISDTELRRARCEALYLLEMVSREMSEGDPELVYDGEHDVFRLRHDGRFAFGRAYADWELLRKRGTWNAD